MKPPGALGKEIPENRTFDIHAELDSMNTIPDFEPWLLDNLEDILHVQRNILKHRLSKEPAGVVEDAKDAEAWYARMADLLADANAILDKAETDNLMPKSKEYTDYDREVKLAGLCAIQRSVRDKILGLVNGLEKRVSLAQSIMKAENPSVYGNK